MLSSCKLHLNEKKKETWINPITVKFRKYAPGLIFFKGPYWGVYFWRGLYSEGDKRFKIDWASLIDGGKFTVFPLFHSVFEGNLRTVFALLVWGAYIWRGFNTWRGLFSEFYGNLIMFARVSFHPLFLRIYAFKKQGEINHIYHITKSYK